MKLKEAFKIYISNFINAYDSKKNDKTVFRNNLLPIIKVYEKYKNYFTEEMGYILLFCIEAMLNRKDNKEKMKNYQKIIENLLTN